MNKLKYKAIFFSIPFLFYCFPALSETQWKTLAPGLEYTKLHSSNDKTPQKLHAFRIDLTRYQLNTVLANTQQQDSLYVSHLATQNQALIAINGGFFEPNLKPLGLRVQDKTTLNPIKGISWWGIFIIQDNKAKIVKPKQYQPNDSMQFAIQAGPRLIEKGKILPLKSGAAQRSALGITKAGQVIIVATENWMMNTTELAQIMGRAEKQNGLACWNALNLDGGTSSQIYAHVGEFILNVASLRSVSDAITVTHIQQKN